MSAIGPGDFVECIDSGPARSPLGPILPGLVLGSVYRVTGCYRPPWLNEDTFALAGFLPYGEIYALDGVRWIHGGFATRRFRPFHGPELEHLNRKIDEPVKEQA